MYVFHWPIHIALAPLASGLVNAGSPFRRLLTFVLYAAVVGMLSLASAVISWKVLESPFLRLKDRLAPRPAAQARPDQPT
jgi:peptidoglycan/LPS O-acetylase OafA/YrhL